MEAEDVGGFSRNSCLMVPWTSSFSAAGVEIVVATGGVVNPPPRVVEAVEVGDGGEAGRSAVVGAEVEGEPNEERSEFET